jgi:hypothetical protein
MKNNYKKGTPLPNGEYKTKSAAFKIELPSNTAAMPEENIYRICTQVTIKGKETDPYGIKGPIHTILSGEGDNFSLLYTGMYDKEHPKFLAEGNAVVCPHTDNVNFDFENMTPDLVGKIERATPVKVPFREVMFLIKQAKYDAIYAINNSGGREDDKAVFKDKLNAIVGCYEPMGTGDHIANINKIKNMVVTAFNEYKNAIVNYKVRTAGDQTEQKQPGKLSKNTINTEICAIKNLIGELEL